MQQAVEQSAACVQTSERRRMAPRFVRGVALRGAHVDGEPRSKTCSGRRRKATVRAGDVSDLHPTASASSVTKGARRTSSRGSIRRRVGFLRSRPSTRARARRSSKDDRRGVRGSQSRHQAPSQSDAWSPASSKATSDAAWATMQLWSPVSGSDRHSVVRRKATDGSAARPRGKRGRARTTFSMGSCPRSKLRQKSNDGVEAGTCNAEGNQSAASTG